MTWIFLALSCALVSEREYRERFDLDDDGVPRPADCDDDDDEVGAAPGVYADVDGDGYGDDASRQELCDTTGFVTVGGDCDDHAATVYPDALEACNDVDDNCDGVGDDDACYTTAWGSAMGEVPAGTFDMGAAEAGDDEQPVHTVTLTRGYWLGVTEVTQAQWALWTDASDTTPSAHRSCDGCPVEQVSWTDAAQYCNALSVAEGLTPCYGDAGDGVADALAGDLYACEGYRLPTEAEWEYAARAGEATLYPGSDNADTVGWTDHNAASDTTHEAGTRQPNAWGFYDLAGNAWEWTNDWYDADYYSASPASDPLGPESAAESGKARRGGSLADPRTDARTTNRSSYVYTETSAVVGFRLARTVPQ